MGKKLSNNIAKNKENQQELFFCNDSALPEKGFTWFKGDLDMKSFPGKIFLRNVKSFNPNLKQAVIDFININPNDMKDIEKIIKRWGLFGLDVEESYTSPFWLGTLSLEGFREVMGKYADKQNPFFENYYEYVSSIQEKLNEIREFADVLSRLTPIVKGQELYCADEFLALRISNLDIGKINLVLGYSESNKPIWHCPVHSLYDAIRTYLIWTVKERYPLRVCNKCKRYYWDDGIKSKTRFCTTSCSRKDAHDTDNEKRWVKRRYKKLKEAGAFTSVIVESIVTEAREKNRRITEDEIRGLIQDIVNKAS